MGAKFLSIASLVVFGWMLADVLLHPKGTAALGSATNSILSTVGNQVTGVSGTGSGGKTVLGS
jgi:hypothetical protein